MRPSQPLKPLLAIRSLLPSKPFQPFKPFQLFKPNHPFRPFGRAESPVFQPFRRENDRNHRPKMQLFKTYLKFLFRLCLTFTLRLRNTIRSNVYSNPGASSYGKNLSRHRVATEFFVDENIFRGSHCLWVNS